MTTIVVGRFPARDAIVLSLLLAVFQSAAFASAVGFTSGEASVDPTGAANYRIPIAVPPGRGGLQPHLAFLYHSRARNGHLGVGWSIEGLSAITRCPAAWEPDGYTDAVRLESTDRFCLDGQKLLAVNSTYGASGAEYRTEVESFRRVISYGSAGTGPARFQVHTNAGLIIEYGDTTNSRILAEGSSTALLWAVSRIADRNGNAIDFEYQQNGATGEHQIAEIRYQGQSAITVKFNYGARPDVTAGWIAGSRTGLSMRLENVETRYSGSLVRRYDLSYTAGAKSGRSLLTSVTECNPTECFPPTTLGWLQGYRQFMSTGRQLSGGAMESMRILDMNGDGWPDVVYWRAGHWRLRLGPFLDTEIEGPACDQNTDACQDARGYGLTYRSTFGRDVLYIPSGTSAYQRLVYSDTSGLQILPGGPPKDGHEKAIVLDLNGDGFEDIITVSEAPGGGPRFRAFLGHPTTGTVASGHTYQYDGTGAMYGATVFPLDGRPGFLYGGCGDYIPTQEGGPGCVGQLQFMTISGGAFTSRPVTDADWFASQLNNVSPTFMRIADVNGDGLPDLLYLQDADAFTQDANWRLLLNNGASFEPAVMTSIPRGSSTGQIHAIDWRGDGAGVLAVPNQPQTRWEYWGWNGTGFTLLDTTSDLSSTQALGQVQYLDLNRDGVVDRLTYDGSTWYVRFGVPVFHDLLDGVTVGEGYLGLRTSFAYVPLGNPKFYTPGDPYSQSGYERAVGTMAVVAHVASETGLSALTAEDTNVYTSYSYANGRIHRSGRGFVGFEEVTAVNENSMTRTVNRHLFEFPYTGLIKSTEQMMITGYALDDKTFDNFSAISPRYLMLGTCNEPGIDFGPGICDLEPPEPADPPMTAYIDQPTFTVGNIVSASSHIYTSGPVAGASASIQYPRVDETAESSHDIATGNELRRTVTSFVYDSFGNPTTITATTTNGAGGDLHRVTTTNVYSNDVGSWCLGRVTSASAVHEAPNTSSLTRSSSFAYDNCQLTTESVNDAPSLTTTYQHDGFGNRVRTSVTGSGQTRETVSNYGLSGTFPVTVTNAMGHSESRSWDGRFGVMLNQTGPNGLTTSWTYDAFGRRESETPPGGAPQQTTWSRAWCASSCAHPAARIRVATRTPAVLGATDDATVTELDAHGREVTSGSRTFNGGWVFEYTYYDSLGRVARRSLPTAETSATGASILWVEYKYDQLGRVAEEARPRLNDITAYDYEGLLTRTRHLPGTTEQRIRERLVNVMDRLVAYSDVAPQGTLTTTYGYDAVGNTVSVTDADADGRTTLMQYDARGNKIQMAAPEMGTWSYLHNAFGELTQQTDAEGNVVAQQYDALGRMVGRVDADGTTIWTYDASFGAGVGKPSTVETIGVDGYWEGYAYDIHGQLTDTFTEVDGQIFWTSTDYDEFGRVALVQYPDIVVEAATGGGAPATPTGLVASPAVSADGAFTASWGGVSGPVIRYHLQEERIGGAAGWRNAYYGTALTVLLPGREDGASYRYRIRACGTECGAWSSESNTVSVLRAPDAPGAPNPSASSTSSGNFTVGWAASQGPNLAGYKLERRQDGAAWQSVTLADPIATSHSASITPTPDLRTYSYRVQAHNQNDAGSDWVEGYAVSVQGPPGQPGSITVPATATVEFAVEWTAAFGTVDRYELYRATSAGFGDEQLVYSGGGFAHSDPPADGTYYYRVQACNDLAGCGQPRASGAVVKQSPPPPPHSFVPLQQTFYNQQVYVSWQAMSTPDRYEVFRTAYGVMPNLGVDTPVCNGTALYCQDPAPNGTWDYHVRACVSFACSETIKASHPVEVLHSPGVPASISVPSQVTNGTVSLSWGAASGSVTTYELYESTSSAFSSQTLVYNGAGQSQQLSRGAGTYYYRVRACNAAGCSAYRTGSNAATVIVAPGQPSSISVPSGYVTNGTISVSWGTASNSPTWYELYENSSLVYSGLGYGTTLYGRGNGTYYYQVRACNAAGCGPYRASSGVTVLYLPSTPTGFYASPTYSTEGWYNLYWAAASGASYYEVSGHGTVSGTWASITQFANGTYSHYVRACNAAGCSGWAGPVSITVQMCSWNCQEQ